MRQAAAAFQPALRRIQVVLQVITQHGQVVDCPEGGRVLELQRQAVVEEALAG